jgi:hypothetical protein
MPGGIRLIGNESLFLWTYILVQSPSCVPHYEKISRIQKIRQKREV